MNSYNFLIVEDEDLAARKLKKMVADVAPELNCLYTSDSIENTIQWLDNTMEYPDLIFMDIELADGQSFEIFSRTEIKSPVIFTTAYDEFALKAFKVNSIDYLLKPIKKEDLESAISKWKEYFLQNNNQETQSANIEKLIESLMLQQTGEKYRNRFLVKQGHKLIPVATEDISYFYTEDKVVFIKTKANSRFIIDFTLDELENILDPEHFYRANRQFILNTSCVREIHSWFNGKLKVSVEPKPEEEVIISREKASEFKMWMGE